MSALPRMLRPTPALSRRSVTRLAPALLLLWIAGGCGETDEPKDAGGQCEAGATCLDASGGGADGNANLYGDQHSGPLAWNEGGQTVFDSQSGLLWQRDVSAEKFVWDAAVAYCENLTVAGHDDWQLPHRDQLESIVLNLTTSPSIDTLAFPDTPAKPFWTRTLWGPNAAMEAYGVDFKDGGTGHALKSEPHHARCVRTPAVRT